MGKQCKQCQTLFFWAPKSLPMVIAAMKLKDAYSLEGMDSSLTDWRQPPGLWEIRLITLFSVGCCLGCWLWVRLLKFLFLLCYLWLASLKKLFSLSQFSSVQFSHLVMSDSLWPHGLQHARLPCPSPTLELAQTHVHQIGDAIQPSHPLSSPSPLAFNPSQNQGLFKWVSSSHQVAKVFEFQL